MVTRLFFYLGLAILPVLYVPGMGTSYREPRILLLGLLAAMCGWKLIRQESKPSLPLNSIGCLLLLVWLGLRTLSYHQEANLGLYLLSLATGASAFLILLYTYNNSILLRPIMRALQVGIMVAVPVCLAHILLGYSPPFGMNSFGSIVGERNSLSVYLSQFLPIGLILCDLPLLRKREKPFSALPLGLLAILVWIVIESRTRSAWWMLAVLETGLGALALLSPRKAYYKRKLAQFTTVLTLGILGALIIPTSLSWKSTSPFQDSLRTMTDLRQSSGRDQLWKVGWTALLDHPWRGNGAGSWPVVMRGTVPKSGVSAKTFAFLRPDLPILNDYLQEAVESGIPSAILLLILAFGAPFAIFLAHFRNHRIRRPYLPLLGLSCLMISIDAIFDYPFQRADSLCIFLVLAALALRSSYQHESVPLKKWIPGALAAFVLFVTLGFGASLTLRRVDPSVRRLGLQSTARALWPWDIYWNDVYVTLLLENGKTEAASRYALERHRDWPSDPYTFMIDGRIDESTGRTQEAMSAYRRAAFQVEGGRCFEPALDRIRSLPNAGLPDCTH